MVAGIENSLVGAAAPTTIVRPDLFGMGAALVAELGELLMIWDLHCQVQSV